MSSLVRLGIVLGLLLSAASCHEAKGPTTDGAAAGQSAPDTDFGESCELGSLGAYCKRFGCPMSLADAPGMLCENQQPHRALSAEDLAPKHQRAANVCGGTSVSTASHIVPYTGTRYDYDANGELVGVTLSHEQSTRHCPETAGQTFGRVCKITGSTERLCPVSCPAIACNGGLFLQIAAVAETALYEGASIEACRNDLCSKGQLQGTAHAGSGFGTGIYVDRLSDNTEVRVSLWLDPSASWLEIDLITPNSASVKDGDRYTIKLTQRNATRMLLDFDRTVDHYDSVDMGQPCQTCNVKRIDLRSGLDADAGSH